MCMRMLCEAEGILMLRLVVLQSAFHRIVTAHLPLSGPFFAESCGCLCSGNCWESCPKCGRVCLPEANYRSLQDHLSSSVELPEMDATSTGWSQHSWRWGMPLPPWAWKSSSASLAPWVLKCQCSLATRKQTLGWPAWAAGFLVSSWRTNRLFELTQALLLPGFCRFGIAII